MSTPEFDDIWFTYKARISAELRLKNNEFHSQALLVYYAIASSCAAIVALRYPSFAGKDTDIYTAVLSVALLAVSIWVSTRDYRGRSLQMRANHIALKKLYDQLRNGLINTSEKPERYSGLLLECENHTSYDDRYSRISNRSGLTSRIPTKADWLLLILTYSSRVVFLISLYFLPFTILARANA